MFDESGRIDILANNAGVAPPEAQVIMGVIRIFVDDVGDFTGAEAGSGSGVPSHVDWRPGKRHHDQRGKADSDKELLVILTDKP